MPISNAPQPSTTRRVRSLPAVQGTSCGLFSPERFFLLAAITLIIISTLAPFESSFSRTELVARFQDGATTSLRDFLKLAVHLIAFFVLGGLIASVYDKSLHPSGFKRFAALAILFCAALELAQLFQLSRHARVLDFLFNSAGLLLGLRTAIRWEPVRRIRLTLQSRARHYSLGLPAFAFMIALGLWSFVGLRPLMGSLWMDWNTTYPLVIANETDGSRPWLGEIRYVGIYDRALDLKEISSASVRQRGFGESGLLAGYDFTHAGAAEVWPQGSLRSRDLVVRIPPNCIWEDHGGIVLKEGTVLTTRGLASGLTKAISSSGAFSVEAWIRPANQGQTGPARIVGISDSIWRRNFTLGEEDSSAVFRVRNTTNGPNGADQELEVKDAIRNSLQHLVAIYDHGVSMMLRDGRLLSPVLDLRENKRDSWTGGRALPPASSQGFCSLFWLLCRRMLSSALSRSAACATSPPCSPPQ